MFGIRKKKRPINLIDFSARKVSTGQVKAMLDYLSEKENYNFKQVQANYSKNQNGDLRCYLTIDYFNGSVIQWFEDRNPSQVEGFADSFQMNEKGQFNLVK